MIKSKKNNVVIFLIIIILFFIIAILIINSNYNNAKKENQELFQTLNSKEKDLISWSVKYNALDLNYNQLLLEHQKKINEIDLLTKDYSEISEDYEILMYDVGIFKTQIEESMDWFKVNSDLESVSKSKTIKSNLHTCLDCGSETCKIKTACIDFYVNERKLGLSYIDDNKITDKQDKLQSLEDFIINKKGDCEDYSLLFAAELRYLINYIINEKNKIPVIEGIIESETTKNYVIYGDWYYDSGVEPVVLSPEYIFPYVACGLLYDPIIEDYGGHCEVLITNKEIKEVSDLEEFTEGYLIEPQGGILNNSKIINNGLLVNAEEDNLIYSIITENDYYMHELILFDTNDYESHKWYSYNYYLEKIKNLE